jgi:hypothetical protein
VYFEGHGRLDTPVVRLSDLQPGTIVPAPGEPKCASHRRRAR